jgi:hypothetical protein
VQALRACDERISFDSIRFDGGIARHQADHEQIQSGRGDVAL